MEYYMYKYEFIHTIVHTQNNCKTISHLIIMECKCSAYDELVETTQKAIEKINQSIEYSKRILGSFEEKSIRSESQDHSDLKECCQITRDDVIAHRVELYQASCVLDALNARLKSRDPGFLAELRKRKLEEYKLKHPEHFQENVDDGEGLDEID